MPDPVQFSATTVLKRDTFSETVLGHAVGAPETRLVLRRLDTLSQPGRSIGRRLAGREARALRAVAGIPGTPALLSFDADGLLRVWLQGTPLQLARPAEAAFYRDALRLLRQIHRAGVTHNDLAKPQNWLMTPDGRAAVIDFQIATVSPRRGRLFRLRAYEDLRHLLKQKRRYAPEMMTARERRILDRRSLPSRVWRNTAKPAYNFVTRRLLHWSDGEGAGRRLRHEAPELRAVLLARPSVEEVHICTYPRAGGGQGLYGFVETPLTQDALRRLLPERQIELLQPVPVLPRDAAGQVRDDLLTLVAGNRLEELTQIAAADPPASGDLTALVAGRLNLTDRY
jgi:hypothetical protein